MASEGLLLQSHRWDFFFSALQLIKRGSRSFTATIRSTAYRAGSLLRPAGTLLPPCGRLQRLQLPKKVKKKNTNNCNCALIKVHFERPQL